MSRLETRTIAVTVTFFADLRRFLPRGADGPQRYSLPAGATVNDLLATIGIAPETDLTVAVDGELADRETRLRDGADVMLLSPMEGGSATTVERHYGRGPGLVDAIRGALAASGKDLARLTPADLAPVDEFHIRGREATVELAQRAKLAPGRRVLDVGCGLGGSVRYLAAEHGCAATGVDLTPEYVDAARELAAMVKLDGAVSFRQGSALALPFDAGSFDVVWTEHAQMNIADKRTFYAEIARVLRPGGRLVFHDIFQGPTGPPHFPVPWADDASISHLQTPDEARARLADVGLTVHDWVDETEPSLAWFAATVERLRTGGPSPLGLHLLMGPTARDKFANMRRNLEERRIVVFQATAEKA
jgi:SAM-dependent methyltransferase/sulfur carrier protein ThiS